MTTVHAEDRGASAASVQFDTKVLADRGYGEDVARFFAQRARFLPGVQMASVSINAGYAQLMDVRFNGDGDVCFDRQLLSRLRLRRADDLAEESCHDVRRLFPGSRVELQPGMSRVAIVVPEDAFDPDARDGASQRGGRAVMMNYRVFAQRFDGAVGSRDYFQAQIEPGFNIDNWVFRSSEVYTKSASLSTTQWQNAYVQRNIESLSSLWQAGSLYAASDFYAGLPVLGAQWFSDTAQAQAAPLVVPIQGIATSHAVIELRQRGQVIYRTVVSPGPYALSEVTGLMPGAEIEVRVTEEDGIVSQFIVPAPMAESAADLPTTYHMGGGRYRSLFYGEDAPRAPMLAYGDYAFSISPHMRLGSGAMVAQGYQNASMQWSLATRQQWVSAGLSTSHAQSLGSGVMGQAQASMTWFGNVSGGVAWQLRSRQYAMLEDSLWPNAQSTYTQSLSASVNWASLRWGAFAYTLTHAGDALGTSFLHAFTATRRLGRLQLNVSWQRDRYGRSAAYLALSLPLGRESVSARYYQNGRGDNAAAMSYQGRVGNNVGYQVDGYRDDSGSRVSASAQANSAYAQWAGGLSQTTTGQRSFYASATGSMVLTGDRALALSANRLGDSFVVVKVPELTGLRLNGPGTQATVSRLGTALLSMPYPYRTTRIQVDGKSLPLNYRLETTQLELNLARGAVFTQSMLATAIRQLVLQARMRDGSTAPQGTSVFNEQGDFVGTVVGDGNVLLINADIGTSLYLEPIGASRCKLQYTVPQRFDPELPYQEAPASCE
ncbi:hypothetical protein EO087_12780 [Dyella sp. M7H15-1]|uniref:fimbria/pilus outer membrane usher protein n=1 Tax=Dyella sp. M7H15-1 TaxID=2501295 RepID=UPI001004EF99|nr:fimbria/pilus outer membrane usher protein [Dyella sp. M7H15-1]QAU24755.1 hypothetical protein EO087_12780 [Dyella sp. M7H15-1]